MRPGRAGSCGPARGALWRRAGRRCEVAAVGDGGRQTWPLPGPSLVTDLPVASGAAWAPLTLLKGKDSFCKD